MTLNRTSIAFLHTFDLGNRHIVDPNQNILSVTSTAAGDFNVNNILTESTRRVWRSATALTEQSIVIKAEKKSTIDCFAILGHNFTDTAVIKVQANISNNFLVPPVTRYLAWNEYIVMSSLTFGGEYEYYKISILDPANPCGYLEIGRIIGGRALQLIDNEDITDSYSVGKKDLSETMKTEGYFRVSNENIIARTFSANFQKIYTTTGFDTNYKNLITMFKTVKVTKPFLTILDVNNPYKFNIWGQLTDIPDDAFGINDFVNFPLRIEEVF
jgi:hypothetical protein